MLSVQHNLFSIYPHVLDLNLICLSFFNAPPWLFDKDLKLSTFPDSTKRQARRCTCNLCCKIFLWMFCASLWFTELSVTLSFNITWLQERVDNYCLAVHFLDQLWSVIMQHAIKISQKDGGGWPVILVHCVSNLRLNVCYIFASSVLQFLLSRHGLMCYFPPFSCLFRLICVCILSFPSLLLSSLQPQRGRSPNDPPQSNICPVISKSFIFSRTRDLLSTSQQGNSEGFVV